MVTPTTKGAMSLQKPLENNEYNEHLVIPLKRFTNLLGKLGIAKAILLRTQKDAVWPGFPSSTFYGLSTIECRILVKRILSEEHLGK